MKRMAILANAPGFIFISPCAFTKTTTTGDHVAIEEQGAVFLCVFDSTPAERRIVDIEIIWTQQTDRAPAL